MVMSETAWYGSKKHFDTEMSYEEYLEENKKKKASKVGSAGWLKKETTI